MVGWLITHWFLICYYSIHLDGILVVDLAHDCVLPQELDLVLIGGPRLQGLHC